ncbi:ribonuclease P [Corynebacterium gerontici]|uniref:Ribonuclease P n=1 Tax=Corynebacterium gerontici TaxID=2079234 RepID=A0A3G6J405_9CORY|nr:ribonuclease P [Corynebacterium gerontici]
MSKAVGNAVVRHATSRKLRHAIMQLLPLFPADADVVVRALPKSGEATLDELVDDIRSGLEKIQRRSKKSE